MRISRLKVQKFAITFEKVRQSLEKRSITLKKRLATFKKRLATFEKRSEPHSHVSKSPKIYLQLYLLVL